MFSLKYIIFPQQLVFVGIALLLLTLPGLVKATRTIEKTESCEVHEYKFIGLLEIRDVKYALIVGPDKEVHRVGVGNYIGRNNGRIEDVTDKHIRINEVLPVCNQPGEWGSILNILPRQGQPVDSKIMALRRKKITETYNKETKTWRKCLLP